jgi:hypothetical protein
VLRALVDRADARGVAPAARRHGVSKSIVSRQPVRLEAISAFGLLHELRAAHAKPARIPLDALLRFEAEQAAADDRTGDSEPARGVRNAPHRQAPRRSVTLRYLFSVPR